MTMITGMIDGDSIRGTAGDDQIRGTGSDDIIIAARGDDNIQGGRGNDVMMGGLGADTFQFSAGHIGDGEVDYITDFDIRQGDSLKFLDSGSGAFEVLSVERTKLDVTEANGFDLRNNVDFGTDIVFTVRHAGTGATQEIVLLDSWSGGLNSQWEDLLADMGLGFGTLIEEEEPEVCEIYDVHYGNDLLVDDSLLVV